MNIALWIAQVLLAVVFFATGFMKAFMPLDRLSKSLDWVKEAPAPAVRFIGIAEILGALGLVLPTLTGIMPWLTPLAAVGLALVMIGASVFNASRGEHQKIALTVVLLLLAAFVAYGRFIPIPA